MTIGFSSSTSRPASRQAFACAKWKTCGVKMKTASSSPEYRRHEPGPVRLVGRHRQPVLVEQLGRRGERGRVRLADGDDLGLPAFEDLLEVMAGHDPGPDEPDARACRTDRGRPPARTQTHPT